MLKWIVRLLSLVQGDGVGGEVGTANPAPGTGHIVFDVTGY